MDLVWPAACIVNLAANNEEVYLSDIHPALQLLEFGFVPDCWEHSSKRVEVFLCELAKQSDAGTWSLTSDHCTHLKLAPSTEERQDICPSVLDRQPNKATHHHWTLDAV